MFPKTFNGEFQLLHVLYYTDILTDDQLRTLIGSNQDGIIGVGIDIPFKLGRFPGTFLCGVEIGSAAQDVFDVTSECLDAVLLARASGKLKVIHAIRLATSMAKLKDFLDDPILESINYDFATIKRSVESCNGPIMVRQRYM